jgi:hypothetical protein
VRLNPPRAEESEKARANSAPSHERDKNRPGAPRITKRPGEMLRDNVVSAKSNVAFVKTNVAFAKTNVAPVKTNVAFVETNVGPDKTNVASVETNVAPVKTNVAFVETNVGFVVMLSWRGGIGAEGLEHRFDVRPQGGDVTLRRRVDDVPIHLEIVVHHDVPHAFDLLPRHLGMAVLQRLREPPGGLPDDHDVPVDVRLERRVAVERGAVARQVARDHCDGVEDILQAQAIGPHGMLIGCS